MAISLDKLMGFHHSAMQLRDARMEVITGNITNANTPGYKAKDFDFKRALQEATGGISPSQSAVGKEAGSMSRTHENHFALSRFHSAQQQYVIPDQPDTGDGNTVYVHWERNKFLEESMRYQASVQFLDGKIKGMKKALSGGQG